MLEKPLTICEKELKNVEKKSKNSLFLDKICYIENIKNKKTSDIAKELKISWRTAARLKERFRNARNFRKSKD
jgi:hypothetical protein